jgi:hypothetical protein
MPHDEVITELWRVKDAIAEEYNCDVHALAASLREDEKKHPRDVLVANEADQQDAPGT